ncbi:MAG: hypothetical protein QW734_04615 [Candidatus Bathyarchaeia archaeon]
MSYEIVIVRTGECKRCGFCCGFVNGKITEGSCIHLKHDGSCGIYDKRNQYCGECGHDHKSCIEGPKFPLNKLNPNCGFKFIHKESGALVVSVELG